MQHYTLTGSRWAHRWMPPGSWPHTLACHKKPPLHWVLAYVLVYICLHLDPSSSAHTLAASSCSAPMGLCLSVALRKDEVYAADRRRRCRGGHGHGHGHDDDVNVLMGGGVSDYGVPLGAGASKADEAVAPRRPSGVLERAGPGGTPSRPIWQRRVLMGVKCQLPRFSGMILYDERGRPVRSGIILRDRARDQEKHAAAINILRDML